MPKTTVDEHRLVPAGEYQVRMPREITRVEAVTVSQRMNQPANTHLWLAVLAADSAHPLAPLLGRQRVHLLSHLSPVSFHFEDIYVPWRLEALFSCCARVASTPADAR